MATKTLEIHGILEWAKLFEDDRDNGEYDVETDGATSIDIIVDPANQAIIEAAGVRKKARPDPDGRGVRYAFKRAWKDKYEREWAEGPPRIFTPAGNAWSKEEDGLIGNGSVGVVYLDVWSGKMGVGSRLSGVQVIDHVTFSKEGGGGSPGLKPKDYTQGQAQAPQSPPPTAAPVVDDNIPF